MLMTDNPDQLQVPILTGFFPLADSDAATIELLTTLERVLTSRQNINLDEGLKLHVIVVNAPVGESEESAASAIGSFPPVRGKLWKKEKEKNIAYIKQSRHLLKLPSFQNHDILKDCCFLPALVAGLIIEAELAETNNWTDFYQRPKTEAWKKLKGLKKKGSIKSKKFLMDEVLDFIKKYDIDLEVIRRGNIKEICYSQIEEKNIQVNLNFYLTSYHQHRFFNYPSVYRHDFPTVDILINDASYEEQELKQPPTVAMRSHQPAPPLPDVRELDKQQEQKKLPTEVKGVSWPVKKRQRLHSFSNDKIFAKRKRLSVGSTPPQPVWHASSVVINRHNFFSRTKGHQCRWCGRIYLTLLFFRTHPCRSLPLKREKCFSCYRIRAQHTDFLSLVTREDLCIPDGKNKLICPNCKTSCLGQECFKHHRKMCVKRRWALCQKCLLKISKTKPHKCGKKYCQPCGEHYDMEMSHHDCFIAPCKPLKQVDGLAIWDTETVFSNKEGRHRVNAVGLAFEDEKRGHFTEVYFYSDVLKHPEDGQLKKHAFIYNYLTKDQKCPPLPNQGEEEEEVKGGERKKKDKKIKRKLKRAASLQSQTSYFRQNIDTLPKCEDDLEKDETALTKFINFILCDDFDGYTFIAHYGQAFDMILLLRHLLNRNVLCRPIFEGNKCMLLELEQYNIRFIDSHRYITGPLDGFPKRFPTIPSDLAKGCFPYKFNQPQFYNYEGKVPPLNMFVDDFSNVKKIDQAKTFIKEYKGSYNFKQELHHYLVKDIKLLTWGVCCLTEEFNNFQALLQETSNEEKTYFFCFNKPFLTVPQFIHTLWRTFGLKHRLYLLSNQTLARKASTLEIEWLAWEQKLLDENNGGTIQTAFSHKEGQHREGKYSCDGYCFPYVYEFLGCAMHCHYASTKHCSLTRNFSSKRPNPFRESPTLVKKRFDVKTHYLQSKGLHIKVMWECEWLKLKQTSTEIQKFLQHRRDTEILPPHRLRIRDALRGGRCEAFRLIFDQAEQPRERLLYIDKNSLYPYIAIKFKFPVGKPITLVGKECETKLTMHDEKGLVYTPTNEVCSGLIQATVLPPDSLFLPALPVMCDNKLLFGLCATCMKEKRKTFCDHKDAKRWLTDTWTCHEVSYAIVHCGYKLIKIHEALIYTDTEEIFRDFYSLLAKMKITSEKPPHSTEEELDHYVESINRVMPWLNITKEDLRHNEALRAFAKLLSNSALGKLSQNELKKRVCYVRNWEELYKLITNPNYKISTINPIHDFLAEVTYEERDFMIGLQRNTHCVVYSHVTAFARTEMLQDMKLIQQLGYNLFYTDTDSIIFSLPDDDYNDFCKKFDLNNPAYGLYKEETKARIIQFASLGCKNYSLVTSSGEECVKVRGFTLSNPQALNTLSHTSMTSMVRDFLKDKSIKIETKQSKLQLDRRKCSIHNNIQIKSYSNNTFDKRYIPKDTFLTDVNATSIPYGCRHTKFADVNK
jgi:hypothetical protein